MAKYINERVRVTIEDSKGATKYYAQSAGICGTGTKVTAINLYHDENTLPEPFEATTTTAACSETPESTDEDWKHKQATGAVLEALHAAETALLAEAQQRANFNAEADAIRRKHDYAIQRAILKAQHAGVDYADLLAIGEDGYTDVLENAMNTLAGSTELDLLTEVQ